MALREITIDEFCRIHGACEDGRRWAVENCRTMLGAWNNAPPAWRVWIAVQRGVLPADVLRRFGCAMLAEMGSCWSGAVRELLLVADRYGSGECDAAEMEAAAREFPRPYHAVYGWRLAGTLWALLKSFKENLAEAPEEFAYGAFGNAADIAARHVGKIGSAEYRERWESVRRRGAIWLLTYAKPDFTMDEDEIERRLALAGTPGDEE